MEKLVDRSRSWILTINAETHTQEEIQEKLIGYTYIGQLEKGGKTDYLHYQIYIENDTAIRFETLKNKFPTCHAEQRNGTKQQAYDYVTKSETKEGETFGNGEIDLSEKQGKRFDIHEVYQLVEEGLSNYEISQIFPLEFTKYYRAIDVYRQNYLRNKYQNCWRDLEVTYIWGASGKGKSRYVMDKYGYKNVCRVTEYPDNWGKMNFDKYNGEDVLMFEEFRSNIRISQMLNYLDGYPLELPARNADKVACYTKVFITTNIPITKQYPTIKLDETETWNAFLRRITHMYDFDKDNLYPMVIDKNSKEQMKLVIDEGDLPF